MRAIWCLSTEAGSRRTIYLSRRFPTVERKERLISQAQNPNKSENETENYSEDSLQYSPIPYDDAFLLDKHIFPYPPADAPICNIPPCTLVNPWSESKSRAENLGITAPLWPVMHISRKGITYVAIPAIGDYSTKKKPNLLYLPCISTTVAFLENLSQVVAILQQKVNPETLWEEVDAMIGFIMPFGKIIDSQPERVLSMAKQGFSKLPATQFIKEKPISWKPFPPKGKGFSITFREEVLANISERTKDQTEFVIKGAIEVLAIGISEVSVSLISSKEKENENIFSNFAVSPFVTHHDFATSRKQLKFTPPGELFTLCAYSFPIYDKIPVIGNYNMKQLTPTRILLQLKLQFDQSVTFSSCSTYLPFPNRGKILNADSTPTMGNIVVSHATIQWNLGNKFNTKNTCSLAAYVDFEFPHNFDEEKNPAEEDRFCVGLNAFAEVRFEADDFTFSDFQVDTKTLPNPVTPLIKKITTSSTYKIWNTLGDSRQVCKVETSNE